jgi:hypothetical protein
VDDIIDAMQSTLETIKIAYVTKEPTQPGVVIESYPHFVLLKFVSRKYGDSARAHLVKEVTDEGATK